MVRNIPQKLFGRILAVPFNLTEFNAEIAKSGIARPSYFIVMITLPTQLSSAFPQFQRSIPLRIETASLPTRIVLTHDQRYYGAPRRIPYGYASQDLAFTVILSEDYREREVFLAWQDMMLGISRTYRTGQSTVPVGVFDAGYYKDAIEGASVELRMYGTSPASQSASNSPRTMFGELQDIASAVGFDTSIITSPLGFNIPGLTGTRTIDAALKINLVEPFPINVNEVPLSWADDGYARLNVIMQHRYVKEVSTVTPEAGTGTGMIGMLRSGINSFNQFKPIVSLIRNNGASGLVSSIGGSISSSATNALNNFRI